MRTFRLLAMAGVLVMTCAVGLGRTQSAFAFGNDNECAVLGDCQAFSCQTNALSTPGVQTTGDVAVIFGNGGGGVATACGITNAPNLAVTSVNNGGIAVSIASFGATTNGTNGSIAKSSSDGFGSLVASAATGGSVGVSTTAGTNGLAIGSAVNTSILATSQANGAFGLSAFGGETIAAPNVQLLPAQTDCVSVGNAIAGTFSFNTNSGSTTPTSSLCVGNHTVVAGQ